MAVKDNGEVKPYLSGGLRTRVLCRRGSGAVAGTGSAFREAAGDWLAHVQAEIDEQCWFDYRVSSDDSTFLLRS